MRWTSTPARSSPPRSTPPIAATLPETLAAAEANLEAVDAQPTPDDPAGLVTDKGDHSREVLKDLDDSAWKTRIAEKKSPGFRRWHGDDAARRAVYNNRIRLLSGVARAAFKLRAEVCERRFALVLDRGGMRRAWLRGRENLPKRYLLHVAGYNLGLLMHLLIGADTPREAAACRAAFVLAGIQKDDSLIAVIIVADRSGVLAAVVLDLRPSPDRRVTSSTR